MAVIPRCVVEVRNPVGFIEICNYGDNIVKTTVTCAVAALACTFFSNTSSKVAVCAVIGTGTLFSVAIVGLVLFDQSLRVTAMRSSIR